MSQASQIYPTRAPIKVVGGPRFVEEWELGAGGLKGKPCGDHVVTLWGQAEGSGGGGGIYYMGSHVPGGGGVGQDLGSGDRR